MKQLIPIFVMSLFVLVVGACQAGWLHQAYQGNFCSHGKKYAVSNSGEITVSTWEAITTTYTVDGQPPNKVYDWLPGLTFKHLEDLDNTIADLQRLSKDMHQVYKSDVGDDSNCTNPSKDGSRDCSK